jgi:NAD(P)-dependent dehydrogenase (short-subunit alcohol dehydrogenase family)
MGRHRVGGSRPGAGRESAIVTGGASGIGRAVAERLGTAGVRVVIADRQVEPADRVASGIRARGGGATAVELDVRDVAAFREVVRATVADAGRLDYLFNNAGIAVIGEMRDYDLADWYDVLDVNLRGVIHGIAAAYPVMIEQGGGHIVNTASLGGLVPGLLCGGYIASKHAVVGLSRALRCEAKRYGVRVSVVCPGLVRTPGLEGNARYGRIKMAPARYAALTGRARSMAMDPSLFARRMLRAVHRNRGTIVIPWSARLFWYLDRVSPWLYGKVTDAILGRLTSA